MKRAWVARLRRLKSDKVELVCEFLWCIVRVFDGHREPREPRIMATRHALVVLVSLLGFALAAPAPLELHKSHEATHRALAPAAGGALASRALLAPPDGDGGMVNIFLAIDDERSTARKNASPELITSDTLAQGSSSSARVEACRQVLPRHRAVRHGARVSQDVQYRAARPRPASEAPE